MSRSYVVTGGERGVGRAIVELLLEESEANSVIAVELDADTLDWMESHTARSRAFSVIGDASDEAVAEEAAEVAGSAGNLSGWVNNAAVFEDARLHSDGAGRVLAAISANLSLATVGCAVAVRRFLANRTGGSIVNVSSHQARRAVRGALSYATAKAAIESLTRSLAVDYGPEGIRTNAVALGSISTARYEEFLAGRAASEARRVEEEMRALHPLGRVGRVEEVADAVAYLLSDKASFISGAILPVDGGRSALGRDPEEA